MNISDIKITSLTPNIKGFYCEAIESNNNYLTIILPGFLDSCLHKHITDLAFNIRTKSAVISFDPLGTWSNGWDDSVYSINTYQAQAKELLEIYGQGKYINIIGHSMGGQMAISLYSILSDSLSKQISSMVIIETPDTIPRVSKSLYSLAPSKHFTRISPFTGQKEVHRCGFGLISNMYYESKNNLNRLKAITCTKQFIAGSLDKQVSESKVRALYNISIEPKNYIVLPIHHNYLKSQKELDLVSKAIINFLP